MSKKQWKQANSYSRERARLAQEATASRDSSYFEEVRKIHDYYFKELEKDIRAFESRYATKEGIGLTEVKKRISEMDVQAFSEKAKRYVEEKNFSDKANEELRLYNLKMKVSRLELLQYEMAVNMVAMADEEYKLAEKFLNQEYVDTLKAQAGILGMSVGSSQAIKAQMDGVINTPFKNVTWSERIWSRQEALRGIVQKATADLVLRGKNPTLAIPQLRKEFDVSVYEAKRLAVTEGARVQMAVQKASFEQMGFEEYEYISEPGACAICRPLDGKHFKVADMQSGLNASPMHPFCRCSTAAHYTGREGKTANQLHNTDENGIIVVDEYMIGRKSPHPIGKPRSVVQHNADNGDLLARSYYDEDGMKYKDIHFTDHKQPSEHPYGNDGEHVHDIEYYEVGNPKAKKRTTRELSQKEREENSDVL